MFNITLILLKFLFIFTFIKISAIIKLKVIDMQNIPEWLLNLDSEDFAFIKRFILSSGSLKEVAKEYGVSYPTVRLRLDRLIQKINLNDQIMGEEPYIALIKRLALEDKLDFETAKLLIHEYQKLEEEKNL